MIPAAALAIIRAALDDYRLTTPTTAATPAGAADRIVEYLASSGYTARRPDARRPWDRTFPSAAAEEIRAALTLHTLLIAPHHSTPATAAARITAELDADDWHIVPNTRIHNAA
ncbi:hypothetical protein [Streptomyces sp. NPDC048644]|uniref:hypothetical protein n=1 Tax=Streptomyces sp. NPDC048644 TaxID=3365582 RepID=UPI00371A6F83